MDWTAIYTGAKTVILDINGFLLKKEHCSYHEHPTDMQQWPNKWASPLGSHYLPLHFSYSGPELASIKKDGNTPNAFGGSKCLPLYTPDSWGVECIQATCLYVFLRQFQFLQTSGVCSFFSNDNKSHSNWYVPRESAYSKEMLFPNENLFCWKKFH